MEKRLAKVNFSAAGGTAGKGSHTCKLTLPSRWLDTLGVSEDARELELTLDGDRIILARPLSPAQFAAKASAAGHELVTFLFYDGADLCTRIYADFTDRSLCVENFTDRLIKTAFGNNLLPTWEDLQAFLAERCIPRQRAGLREYLEQLGLSEYDPMQIVKKTQGRMAEDAQWIEVVEQ